MSPALRLPTLRIATKQAEIELTAKPSLNIDLPDNAQPIATIEDLLSAVRNDHLWITRTGACYIEVSIAVNGCPILENSRLENFIEAISNCEIWDRLGIYLDYTRSCTVQLPGLLSFSLQHPDLSSALVAPASASTASFRTLLVAIDVRKPIKRQEPPEKSARTSKRRKKTGKSKETAEPCPERDLLETLEPADQIAIESFISSLNFPVNCNGRKSSQSQSTADGVICTEMLDNLHSSSLIEILFEQLMLAPEKKHRGCHVWGSGPDYCLTKLAPGVFHMPRLKIISDRAQLLPVVATSLARMQHAESPALRQKVADLRLGSEVLDHSCGEEGGFVHNIKKRA